MFWRDRWKSWSRRVLRRWSRPHSRRALVAFPLLYPREHSHVDCLSGRGVAICKNECLDSMRRDHLFDFNLYEFFDARWNRSTLWINIQTLIEIQKRNISNMMTLFAYSGVCTHREYSRPKCNLQSTFQLFRFIQWPWNSARQFVRAIWPRLFGRWKSSQFCRCIWRSLFRCNRLDCVKILPWFGFQWNTYTYS